MDLIPITIEQLKANALAAYEAGTLLAQRPVIHKQDIASLVSHDGTCTCALGASIPADLRFNFRGRSGILPPTVFGPADADTTRAARLLAYLHDDWATDSTPRPHGEANFLAFITPTPTPTPTHTPEPIS